jgi:hypothetical protein
MNILTGLTLQSQPCLISVKRQPRLYKTPIPLLQKRIAILRSVHCFPWRIGRRSQLLSLKRLSALHRCDP